MSSKLKKAGSYSWLFVFFISLFLGLYQIQKEVPLRKAFAQTCTQVFRQIYLPENKIKSWYTDCLRESEKVLPEDSPQQVMMRLNAQFSALRVSHLGVYGPSEVKKVWQSEYKTTGIQSHYVDGEVVVVDVIPKSPAAQVGFRRGDLIRKINGELAQVDVAETEAGEYEIVRQKKTLKLKVEVAELKVDDQIQLKKIDSQTVVLEVPSFRDEFFEKEKWLSTTSELLKYKKIIIDFRKNSGGNFVAGLRFLSPFLCHSEEVGSLLKIRKLVRHVDTFKDNLAEEHQIDLVYENDQIKLKTFSGYGCISAKLVVVVGSKTASTAEIATQALHDFAQARVVGSSSSGQCLVGIWYPLPSFGEGFQISIPEALYQTQSGRFLEGAEGVSVDRTLYERLEDYVQGEDSLLKQARGI